jgi:hypothetical protein
VTAPPQVRPCSLYRITVWNPHDGYRTKWLGYLGETERLPIERLLEHLKARYPWGDTIVAIEVDDRQWPDKDAVLRAERAAVEAEQPLYNVEWNGRNPLWIPYEQQVAQRHQRDADEGFPPWAPGKRQVRRPRRSMRPPSRPTRARASWRRLPRRTRSAFGWAVVWLVLFALAAWRLPDGLGWSSTAWVGSGAASMAIGVLLPGRRSRRRR